MTGHGGKASVDITINIVGTNDRPTLTLTPTSDTVVSDPGYDKDHNEVAEDLTVTGTFEGADPDSNPTLEFGVSTSAGNRDTAFGADGNTPGMGGGHHSATGTYGSLTIDPSTGEYTYTLDTTKGGAADKLGLKPTASRNRVTIPSPSTCATSTAHGLNRPSPLPSTAPTMRPSSPRPRIRSR